MDSSKKLLVNAATTHTDLHRIARKIAEDLPGPDGVLTVGIYGKGVRVAAYLNRLLSAIWRTEILGGTLDVGMHRDDLDQNPIPRLQPTSLPATIKDKTVILVDDVIHSGRTIRAALDSLHDFGRPHRVLLVALIDRGQRRLPITPDYIGRTVDIASGERVHVTSLENANGFEVHIKAA